MPLRFSGSINVIGSTRVDLITLPPGAGGQGATQFDGSTEYYAGSRPLGVTPTGITAFFSVYFDGGDGNDQTIFNAQHPSGGVRLYIARNSSNKFRFLIRNGSNSTRLDKTTAGSYTAGSWYTVYMTADLTVPTVDIVVNGVSDVAGGGTLLTGDSGIASNLPWAIGVEANTLNNKLFGRLAELWAHTVYMPWATYGTSFWTGTCPANLGDNGETPLGSGPRIGYWPDGDGSNQQSQTAGALAAFTATGTPVSVDGPCP